MKLVRNKLKEIQIASESFIKDWELLPGMDSNKHPGKFNNRIYLGDDRYWYNIESDQVDTIALLKKLMRS